MQSGSSRHVVLHVNSKHSLQPRYSEAQKMMSQAGPLEYSTRAPDQRTDDRNARTTDPCAVRPQVPEFASVHVIKGLETPCCHV